MDPVYQVLGAALGYLIAVLVRYASRKRFWALVAKRAQRYLDDPAIPVNDPREATEQALVDTQHESITRVARKVSTTINPETKNGG